MKAILVMTKHTKMHKNTTIISHLQISYSCVLNVILIIITDIFKLYINEMCCTSEEQPPLHKQYARTVFKNFGSGLHNPIIDTGNLESSNCCFSLYSEARAISRCGLADCSNGNLAGL
jgi:hypothetical protein